MHAVILSAGCGSRMGEYTDELPKAFLEVNGRTLYERQREALDRHADEVTVVLGYKYENVVDRIGDAETVRFDEWHEYENAESLRRALALVDDDVIVMNGDVVVAPWVLDRLVRWYESFDGEYNVVGCLPGVQSDHTAIRCEDDIAIDYGMIEGRRHAGLGVISRANRDGAMACLERNQDEWYPHAYIATPTRAVTVPSSAHVELNRPRDLTTAQERLPLAPETTGASP